MSSVRGAESPVAGRGSPRELRIRNWPLVERPLAIGAGLLALAGVGALVGLLTQSTVLGVLGGSALWASVWRWWLPVTYEIGPRGVVHIALGRRRRIDWRQIDRCLVQADGVWLMPVAASGARNEGQGLFICTKYQADQLVASIRQIVDSVPSGSSFRRADNG